MYTAGRLSTPESKKSSPFLRRVKWRKAMYHNKIDTLHLVRVVTSGQIINSKFFPLGTWCHPLMWFETQSTVKRKVFTNFAMQTTFANFFTNLSIRKLLVWWQWRSVASSKALPWYFWLLILSYLSKKNQEVNSYKCQGVVVGGFYTTHGKLASGFTNMALYIWTGWGLWLTPFSAIQKQQIIEQ